MYGRVRRTLLRLTRAMLCQEEKNFALANQSKVSNREGTGSPGLGNLKFKFKFMPVPVQLQHCASSSS